VSIGIDLEIIHKIFKLQNPNGGLRRSAKGGMLSFCAMAQKP